MPRIRQYAAQYTEADFKKEIFRCLAARYEDVSIRALSRETGISQSTLNHKIRHSHDNLDIGELKKIIPVLNPDPGIILKLLGFSAVQIKKFKEG